VAEGTAEDVDERARRGPADADGVPDVGVALDAVGVQDGRVGGAAQDEAELEGQVGGVTDAGAHALAGMVHNRLGDRNPFSNVVVVYSGSHDDAALNAGVERFSADPSAVRDLSYDSDLTGKVSIPVLTLHAIDDPTAFVEHEAAYRATLHGAQRDKYLVQTFTDEHEHEHSGLSTPEYANSFSALDTWVRSGKKPTAASIAASCPAFDARYGTGCLYRPSYVPPSYATRVNARPGGLDWPALTARQEKEWSRLPMVGIAP
jgi:fermentation-respiration switch protein FrsA (DUF1100 family)